MKQRRYKLVFTAVAAGLVIGSLASCTKNNLEPNNENGKITLAAAVGTSSVEANSTYNNSVQSKAPALAIDELELSFARADESSSGTYSTYAATPLTATRAAGAGEQALTFNPIQYYRADGLKNKLTGWYPQGTYNGTTSTVSWTINGQQDIMTAPMREGSWTNPMPSATFDHRLTQLRFHPYAETQQTADVWGKIIKIEVLNQQNTVSYALTNDATGAVNFSGTPTNTFSAGIADGGAALSVSTIADKTTKAKQMGNAVMIIPQSNPNHSLILRITTANSRYKDVTLTQALQEGVPYNLYLRFTELTINLTATITDWATPVDKDQDAEGDGLQVPPTVGDYYYTDGSYSPEIEIGKIVEGMIFYIDPTDRSKFKVMSITNDTSGSLWAGEDSYEIGADAQSITDGKANVAAMMKYSIDHKDDADNYTKTTGLLATDFPAASGCHYYHGKSGRDVAGTWYLPTKNDLQYLWCAFNGKAPVIWENGYSSEVVEDVNYQYYWQKRLLDADPDGAISEYYTWSSSENAGIKSEAWILDFSDGQTTSISKGIGAGFCCIRDHTVPIARIPTVGDYYYTDGSYSSKIESGKTPNGVIFYVDPTNPEKFKVVALKDGGAGLEWAKKATYVIGADAQSFTDGRANVAAIIKYSIDHKDDTNPDTKTTGLLDTDFQAISVCYEYTGENNSDPKGTWYLPAKNEIQYLWCAWNGYSPQIWEGNNLSTPSNNAHMTLFNKLVTDAGGEKINSDSPRHYSSTERSVSTDMTWDLDFGNNNTTSFAPKDWLYNSTRCIRSI